MKMKLRAAVGSLLISAAVAGAAVVPASGQAGEVGVQAVPGDVCHVHSWAAPLPVFHPTSGSVLYYLQAGDGFRIVAYAGTFYLGHGNGLADGHVWRSSLDQSTCH